MEFPITAQRTQRLLQSTGWQPCDMRKAVNDHLLRKKSYTTFYYYRDGKIRPDMDMLGRLLERVPAGDPLGEWARDVLAGEYGELVG